MRTARSFVRLAISGLILSAVAVACTVEEASDPCTPGETQKCDCRDGSESTQVCRDDGEKFGACDCPSEPGAGGSGNGSAGEGSGVGGDDTKPTAGTSNYGGESGQPGAGGAGGDENTSSGGAMASAGAGGDGGGEVLPEECEVPADPTTCEICYFGGCCTQWAPCVNDDTCLAEFTEVLACTDAIRATRNVTTADLEDCAQEVGQTNGSWSASLSSLTVDMVDCVAGEDGWEGSPWGSLACKAECFDKE